MKKFFVLLFLLPALTAFGQELSRAEKAFIVGRLQTEVKYNYAQYATLPFDWDSLCRASLPALVDLEGDEAFVDGLQRLCMKLGDGHTYIYRANMGDSRTWIRPFPITTVRVGDRVFVTEVRSSVLAQQGVAKGCEILEIDGEQVLDYGRRHVASQLSSSTPQWTEIAPFNSFSLTKARSDKVSRITFRDTAGKVFTVEEDRNIPWDIEPDPGSVMTFELLENNVGYLVINSFMGSNYTRLFDNLYERILETDALIVDMRNNGGGNSGYADYIMSHFTDRPVRMGAWSSPMYVAAHASWNYDPAFYRSQPRSLQPVRNKPVYKKPMALLVNGGTFSSAENFCVAFRSAARGPIIGTPTAGSTGNPIQIELGYGVYASICTKYEWTADGEVFIGEGIVPDIEVEQTADFYEKGGDAVVDRALSELNRSRRR